MEGTFNQLPNNVKELIERYNPSLLDNMTKVIDKMPELPLDLRDAIEHECAQWVTRSWLEILDDICKSKTDKFSEERKELLDLMENWKELMKLKQQMTRNAVQAATRQQLR